MSSHSSTIMGSSHYHTKGKCLPTLNANYFPSCTLAFMRRFIVIFLWCEGYAASQIMEKTKQKGPFEVSAYE